MTISFHIWITVFHILIVLPSLVYVKSYNPKRKEMKQWDNGAENNTEDVKNIERFGQYYGEPLSSIETDAKRQVLKATFSDTTPVNDAERDAETNAETNPETNAETDGEKAVAEDLKDYEPNQSIDGNDVKGTGYETTKLFTKCTTNQDIKLASEDWPDNSEENQLEDNNNISKETDNLNNNSDESEVEGTKNYIPPPTRKDPDHYVDDV